MEETRITFEEGTRRIVLPQAVKQIMGWDKKNPVEIWLNAADDAVILKRHIVTCSLCGSTEDLHPGSGPASMSRLPGRSPLGK